jgi:hypothetical protein
MQVQSKMACIHMPTAPTASPTLPSATLSVRITSLSSYTGYINLPRPGKLSELVTSVFTCRLWQNGFTVAFGILNILSDYPNDNNYFAECLEMSSSPCDRFKTFFKFNTTVSKRHWAE